MWFDAHLDLAYLAESGRDVSKPLSECGGPNQPAAVSIHSLQRSDVIGFLGTIFVLPEVGVDSSLSQIEKVRRKSLKQLRFYQEQFANGTLIPMTDQMTVVDDQLLCGLSIENPECIQTPEELVWWRDQGVVTVSLAWNNPTRFAGGVKSKRGLTSLGWELINVAHDNAVLIDVSHLNDKSLDAVLNRYDGVVIASHSNCRELLKTPIHSPPQRHLPDWAIKEIARRGGVIGLNFYQGALVAPNSRRAQVDDFVRHANYIRDLAGRIEVIGIGSDMDGGISANELCDPIRCHADLEFVESALVGNGWSSSDLAGIQGENWLRVLRTQQMRKEY